MIGQEVEIFPLLNRTTMEVKNIDPLSTRENLFGDICRDLDIQDPKVVEIKTLRRAPWETQFAIVTMSTNNVPRDHAPIRIKMEWTVASGRVLPKIIKCFRCHDIGHVAARCTLCVKFIGVNVRHATGSLTCPVIRRSNRETRSGRRSALIKFSERNIG